MQISSLFSNHMVLQNGESVPVWGWGKAGETITVQLIPSTGCPNAKQTKKYKLLKPGKWTILLDALKISTAPAKISIQSSSGEKAIIEDVLVGEVWLASGQSNMEWILKNAQNAEKELKGAKWPQIRMFTVPKVTQETFVESVNTEWLACNSTTAENFSAVAYFFGRELHQKLKVPIGILSCSWGGSRIQTWISKEVLLTNEFSRKEVLSREKKVASAEYQKAAAEQKKFKGTPNEWLKQRVAADPGNFGHAKGWASSTLDDQKWPTMEIPCIWQSKGIKDNGVVWFRKWVDIPAAWVGKDLEISLGACDKHDLTYFNNEEVGSIGWDYQDPWNLQRKYTIPSKLVKKGKNLITVRVYSFRNGGGITGPAENMFLKPKNLPKGISLAGEWKYKMEHNFGVRGNDTEFLSTQSTPSALFNSMLYALIPYGIRGFIWYQGESNAKESAYYRQAFPQMIREWRARWGARALPFYFVQLASYLSDDLKWPWLREAQMQTLQEPNTGMAVTIDIGDPKDIHPRNKQDVGHRLALLARKYTYGENHLVPSGPLYRNYKIEKNAIRIWFDFADGMQASQTKEITGFTIAGQDKVFYPAKVVVEKDTLLILSSKVKQPIAVRYAWHNTPTCNLINKANLPASPFRTDQWEEESC